MAAGRHPGGHLRSLDERAQLRVLQHGISAYDSPIRRVARGSGRVIAPRDGLLQRALDAISADDNVRIKHLAGRERDARPTRKGRVGLHISHCGAKADAHAGCCAGETEEQGVVVRAVDVVVRRPVVLGHARAPARVPDARARIVAAEDDRRGFHGERCERRAEPPAVQDARRVGRDLDAGADVAEDRGGLEQRDAVAGVRERVGRGEAAEACADDDDVEAERGAAAVVEWRDLLEGNVCVRRWWVRMVLHVGGGEGERWGGK